MDARALSHLTAREVAGGVSDGSLRAADVCRAFLDRIRERDARLHAYLLVDEEGAMRQAEAVDSARRAGKTLGRLAGAPIAVKDILSTRGLRTTCASRMLENWTPSWDATAVERLRSEDAVVLGKTNLDEFAMGSSTENSAFGPTRNPWDLERTPGGSSGGSAAAVADDLCAAALGTDTGGSVRQPAAFCGVVGLKPTYGRISRYGLVAFASSLDQVGPMTKDVRDASLLLSVMAGADGRDSTVAAVPAYADFDGAAGGLAGVRVGLPSEYFGEGLEPGVEASVRAAVDVLRDAGARVVEVSLPTSVHCLAVYVLISRAEASSNLARFDGVRYGLRVAGAADAAAMTSRSREAGFGAEVKLRILLGTFALSAGHHDAYYGQAQKARTLIRAEFDRAFAVCDLLAAPTTPTTAFRLGAREGDPLAMALSDVYTTSANLSGCPAISLPCGLAEGLPVGLQLIGRSFDEATLLRVAAAYEAESGGRRGGPPA